MDYIYFDQAASSFPKPKQVGEAMTEAVMEYGANPGRGGHILAVKAAAVIQQTRIKLAKMFGVRNPNNVCFYQNATYALNQAIQGLSLQKGDHVITTMYEHNSVRRPLEYVKRESGIDITYIEPDINGTIRAEEIFSNATDKTKCVIVSHGSNVTGAITPIAEIGKWCKARNILFIVDASQTAGVLPIDMGEMEIDLLAFPGHKGLLGPQGTGVLIMNNDVELSPITFGGTGSYSETIEQPQASPERFESGTLNTPGIAGLSAGIDEIEKLGLETIFEHEWKLTKYCIENLEKIEGVQVFGPKKEEKRLGVIPFQMEGIEAHEAATILDQHYQIAVRAGLHCSPMAHQFLETIQQGGLIRVSFGPYNTVEEVDKLIEAIKEIKSYF